MKTKKMNSNYIHQDYRNAKIVHFIDLKNNEIFYYKGMIIAKEEADKIVESYYKKLL